MEFPQNPEFIQEHLATGQYTRPRFPIDLHKQMSGNIFEVDVEEEDHWDLFQDITEDNYYYYEGTYALFHPYDPANNTQTKLDVMTFDGTCVKNDFFGALQQLKVPNFKEMETEMEHVNEEGTVKKMIIRRGNGFKVPERCCIYLHYMLMAEGTNKPFDTSLVGKYPLCVDLRKCNESCLLRGLEIAIRSMELHEVSRFLVDPTLAYGVLGCPPRIPPNTKILIVAETLQYIDEQRLCTPLFMSTEERNALPFESIVRVSVDLRNEGHLEYKNQKWQIAIRKWRKAIQILEDYAVVDGGMCGKRAEVLHSLYANLAQGYLKIEKPAQACSACKIGLKLVEGKDAAKLLYRFARAKLMLKDTEAAKELIEQCLRIGSDDPAVKRLVEQIQTEDANQTRALKQMWGNAGTFQSKSLQKSSKFSNENQSQKSQPAHCSSYAENEGGNGKCYNMKNSLKDNLDDKNTNDDAGLIDISHILLDDLVPGYEYCRNNPAIISLE